MLDLHSHILPGIDDGAKTVEESLKLLQQMKEQGITTVVATPHFYPGSMNFEDFIAARSSAADKLLLSLKNNSDIKIIFGAEVLYFEGIGNVEDIKMLTLAGSKYLLLELMGLKKIDDRVIKDIINLKDNLGIIPIIAHIERYCRYKGYKRLLELAENGDALCQINATYTFSSVYKRAVKNLLKSGLVHFVASDCHNPESRPVYLSSALGEIRRMSTVEFDKIMENTESIERKLVAANDKQNG